MFQIAFSILATVSSMKQAPVAPYTLGLQIPTVAVTTQVTPLCPPFCPRWP